VLQLVLTADAKCQVGIQSCQDLLFGDSFVEANVNSKPHHLQHYLHGKKFFRRQCGHSAHFHRGLSLPRSLIELKTMSQTILRTLIQRLRDNDPTLTELDFRNVDGSRSYAFESGSKSFQEMLEALGANHTVQSVNLILRFFRKLSDDEKKSLFRAVGSLPQLESLRVGSSGLAGLALELITEALSNTRNLTSLTLHSIHFKEHVFYLPITKEVLNTKDAEFIAFLRALSTLGKSLECFILEDVEDTFDLNALVGTLMSLPNLQHLSMKSYAFTSSLHRNSLASLFGSPTINSLALRRLFLAPLLPELLISLEDNTVLERLSLEQNWMGQDCGMALAYLLGTNRTLKDINVGYNTIPDACGAAIANALANNRTVTRFDFTANDLKLDACRGFAILLAANNNSSLEHLNLAQNQLRDQGVVMIAGALQTNTTLKSLTLAETQMTAVSCSILAASLLQNSTLERLNIADNRVRDEGSISIAAVLKQNTTLTGLNLFGNQITEAGVVPMVEALNENSTLEKVNLASNPSLGDAVYEALERMIESNYTLKHLWLPTRLLGSTIPSYLKLNKIGRKQLMQEMHNAQSWVDAIEACANDVHCLYFLVRANPAVVSWLP
jgi:Ran GTPase-activating protein (RanGAP) involved in mRNA processing and transport